MGAPIVEPSTREVSEREVAIGPTTRDAVEITAGLRAGDEIVIPNN